VVCFHQVRQWAGSLVGDSLVGFPALRGSIPLGFFDFFRLEFELLLVGLFQFFN